MTRATAEQMAALTVPATLPGVLRRGTPLRILMHQIDEPDETVDGMVVCQRGDAWTIAISLTAADFNFEAPDFHRVFPHTTIRDVHAVDLTDATGRAHVAWAVGARLGFRDPMTTVVAYQQSLWARTNVHVSSSSADGDDEKPFVTAFWADEHSWADFGPYEEHWRKNGGVCLPDGSRLVDALALKAVALHVLGGGR